MATPSPLTKGQKEIIPLLATGLSNKEIASKLSLSEATVKNHVYRLMKHLQAQTS